MNRLVAAAALSVALVFGLGCEPDTNIVLIVTDDQREDTLQHMPSVLSRIAAQGVTFENTFATTSLCAPARASILSGQPASVHGVVGNRPPLGGATMFDASQTIAVKLQDQGYSTALFGKYLNATDLLAEVPAGWDTWHAFVNDGFNYFDYDVNEDGTVVHYDTYYSTDLVRDRSVAFIQEHAAEGPFFLMVAPYAPHFGDSFFDAEPAPRHVGALDGLPLHRPDSYREPDRSDKPPHVEDASDSVWDNIEPQHDPWPQRSQETLLAVDEMVAAILDALEAEGVSGRTLVIYTTDNGYLWGEHQLTGKNQAYEESIRVPLMIRYPRGVADPGSTRTELVNELDLAPTILHAAARYHSDLPGRSLLPVLAGSVDTWRTEITGAHWDLDHGKWEVLFPEATHTYTRGIDWKVVEYADGFVEEYDLVADPLELENMAAE